MLSIEPDIYTLPEDRDNSTFIPTLPEDETSPEDEDDGPGR